MVGKLKSTNCDKLWRVWYVVLIGSLQAFLIYIGIARYLAFKSQAFDAKYGGEWDQAGLNFTLAMLISAMTWFSLFLIVSLSRTVNYANEGTQIGRDTDNLQIIISASTHNAQMTTWRCQQPPPLYASATGQYVRSNGGHVGTTLQRSSFSPLAGDADERLSSDPIAGEDMGHPGNNNCDSWSRRSNAGMAPELMLLNGYNPPAGNLFRVGTPGTPEAGMSHATVKRSVEMLWNRVQRHCLPYSNVLHVLTAISLFLPIAVVHAQQVYHRVVPSDWIWRSELDLLFGSETPGDETTRYALFANSKSFGANTLPHSGLPTGQSSLTSASSSWDDLRAISPEFFNFALALLLLGLHYPSVFWYTNRSFAFVFSLLLIVVACSILIEYNAVFILVKLVWNRHLLGLAGVAGIQDKPFPSWATVPFASIPTAGSTHQQTQANEPHSTGTVGQAPTASKVVNVPSENGLASITPLVLSSLGSLLFLALFIAVFEYGYRQFIDSLSAHRHYLTASANERSGLVVQSRSLLGTQQPGETVLTDQMYRHPGYNASMDTVERRSNLGNLFSNTQYLHHRNHPLESLESLVNGSTKSNHYGSNLSPGPNGTTVVATIPPVDEVSPPPADGQHPHSHRWLAYNTGAEHLHPCCRFCLSACLPRLVALIGCLLVLTIKLPVIVDCLRVYWRTRQTVMLLTPLSCGVAIAAWLIAWFAFSLKPAWRFQVNLPTQPAVFPSSTVPPTVYVPGGGHFPGSTVPVKYFQTPVMTGSVLRTDPGCLMPGPGYFPASTVTNHLEFDREAAQKQDGEGGRMTVSGGSPIYACFHETLGTVGPQFATATGGMLELTTFPASSVICQSARANGGMPSGCPPAGQATGMYGLEYSNEDTEVSSGRQSGNNYVCLQSALHSNSNAAMPTNGMPPVSSSTLTATAGDLQRQLQATSVLLFNRSLLHSVISTTTPTVLITPTTSTTAYLATTTSTSAAVGVDRDQLEQVSRTENAFDAEVASRDRDRAGGQSQNDTQCHSPKSRQPTSTDSTIRELDSHRVVSFQDTGLETVPSQNGAGNNLSGQTSQMFPLASGRSAAAGAGEAVTLSSTPSTFRSTVVFRSTCPNLVNEFSGHEPADLTSTTSLLPGNTPLTGSSLFPRSGVHPMTSLLSGTETSSFYQRSHQLPTTESLQSQDGCVLNSTAQATQPALGLQAMIGDTSTSLQLSNGGGNGGEDEDEEQYPLLLPPCLLAGDSQGARLCSQV